MARIVVIGGGVAGLGGALWLARDGHEVVVLERDATPLPASPVEAFERWDRRGAPQVRHSHAFLARLRNLLRDEAPDVLAALLEAGAEELRFADLLPPSFEDRTPRPGDEDLVMLACRRVTFEWVLRRAALAEPGLLFRDGCEVDGLLGVADGASGARTLGVRLAGGEAIEADWVVDASGRRSRMPRLVEALGAPRPEEESTPCGIFYVSRFYRLLDREHAPRRDTTIGADLGYLKYAIFHGDAGIFSITFAASPEDAPLRALRKVAPFEAAAAALPATRGWVAPEIAEPITEVHAMAQLNNVRRRYLVDDAPLVERLLPIGDASIHTNPLYGRGCTMALVHAFELREVLRRHPDAPGDAARALEAATVRELVPWYEIARTQDRDAAEVARIYAAGGAPEEPSGTDGAVDPKAYMRALVRHGLLPTLRTDPDVGRAFFRSFNAVDAPADLMRDPKVLMKVLDAYQRRGEREDPVLGPGRDAMLATLARAA